MKSLKYEQLLQLSLALPDDDRNQSQVLSAGYTPQTGTWDFIFKYHGESFSCQALPASLSSICMEHNWDYTSLLANYGIITLPLEDLPLFASIPEIEYIEIPKELLTS